MAPVTNVAGVARTLMEALMMMQEEGVVPKGDVTCNLDVMKPEYARKQIRDNADVYVYVHDEEDNPLVFTVGRLR